MIRTAMICCSKCKWCIAEIQVTVAEEERQDWLEPQIAEMKQSFGIPPFYCEKCIEKEGADND